MSGRRGRTNPADDNDDADDSGGEPSAEDAASE